MFGFWNSASAISAAFFIDCAATPALPAADNGRIKPTLTCPVPTASGSWVGPAGPAPGCEPNGLENWLRLCWTPAQAPSRGAPRMRPTAVRRVAPAALELGLSGPTIRSLLLSEPNRPGRRRSRDQEAQIQAYCRRLVNQNKRIMAMRRGPMHRGFPNHCAISRGRPAPWRRRRLPSRLPLCAPKLLP